MKPLALAIASLGLYSASLSAIADEQKVERIEVTGSAIKRINAETALPVQNISQADIQKTGATSVADLLQKLPAMQGFTNDAASVGTSAGGYASASLHGLGDTRSLVLINGRRVATFAGQSLTGASAGVDLNSIPIAAIQRVEVLTDGASAIYGSDAMAGVVNFILKQDYTGVELTAGTVFTDGGGAEEKKASITAGYGDLEKDRFNILVSASHEERTALKATDRSEFAYPTKGYYDFTGSDGKDYRLYTTSGKSIPGNVAGGSVTNADGTVTKWSGFNPYLKANGSCAAGSVQSGNNCRYIYPADLEIIPDSKRDSLLTSFNFKINENHQFFAEAMYSRHETTSRVAPPPGSILVKAGSPFYATYLQPYGVPANADVTVNWRLGDAGQRATNDITEATHLVVGLKGVLAGWDYQTSYTHSLNRWTERIGGGYLYQDALSKAIDSGLINPFVPVGNQSPEAMALINAAKVSSDAQYKLGTTYLDFFQAQASHEIFSLPAGGVQLGTGFDIHRERNKYEPSALAQGLEQGGQFPDFATDAPFDTARTAWGAFGELLVPIVKGLEATTAVRYDHYSDFGSTTNAKLGMRWTPMRNLLVRASVNSGFHAPQPAQTANVTQLYGVTAGNYTCPFAATDSRSAYCVPGGDAAQYQMYVSGNPDLKPEKSTQFTLGFRYEPTTWASLGADLWSIKIRNQFGSKTETEIAQDWEDSIAKGYIRPLYTDPQTKQVQYAFVLPQVNLGDRKTTGIDFDLRFAFKTPVGRVNSSVVATWTLVDQQQTERGGDYYSNLGQYSPYLGAATLRLQGAWTTTLATANFDHTLTLNYKSGYREVNGGSLDITDAKGNYPDDVDYFEAPHKVKAWFPVDWQTAWKTPLQGLRVTGGIYNVFDKKPPFSTTGSTGQVIGYNAQVSDPRGRTYYLNASYKF
ncbi:TonB-dependent receptor [Niveibacterium terrae]|uniref:TonB-dependent receptor n=1 Tax=Niveibacterium terrae TaxID=3373598 RepID=UPI003A91EAE5